MIAAYRHLDEGRDVTREYREADLWLRSKCGTIRRCCRDEHAARLFRLVFVDQIL